MSQFIVATVRTLVPILVGFLLGQLARLGLEVSGPVADGLIVSIQTTAASLYYVAVAWLERKFPWAGWLLGIARNPVYDLRTAAERIAEQDATGPKHAE
ncbi:MULTISPECIES: hypothetical protein [unclassified Cryobacterium]|uniref:hypothetical protein n=1 Tax=unclassified Cryobacterium TaxID=2649013 RepID=UPI002AB477E8|nr:MULTISPECIES: hypothetical protein [unclassified Cryobacterium]MDY7528445.1 hypothetical protein [Cryobacterium sp. 10C2]MDY7555810.1 hypothetical protein [Cryobacterium sp. 10C3]MEB0286152.1 hypothetical protein [Cryobacterium sp. 10S3]MEB0289165.1 hypothetical protein [Cryobacterium sp. 10C2]WPX12210.1 hypothetical protein RHM57_11005 [Cryobacterium sp. 10S3]